MSKTLLVTDNISWAIAWTLRNQQLLLAVNTCVQGVKAAGGSVFAIIKSLSLIDLSNSFFKLAPSSQFASSGQELFEALFHVTHSNPPENGKFVQGFNLHSAMSASLQARLMVTIHNLLSELENYRKC